MILIVRHGAGRARIQGYMDTALADLEQRRPDVHSRLRFCETDGAPPNLDGVGTVIFWLADPLETLHPDCFEYAHDVATEARARNLKLVNPPDKLSNSVKSTQSLIWQEHGIPTSLQYRFVDRDSYERRLDEVSFPAIVRADEEHSQAGMRVCASKEHARSLDQITYPGVVTPFVDVRRDYSRTRPDTVWSRFFHKKRALVFGDKVVNGEVMFSEHPIVGAKTCTFHRYAGPRRRRFHAFSRLNRWDWATVRADIEDTEGPCEHAETIAHAVSVLGLSWAAVDYSELASGEIVIWESNPYFFLPPVDWMYLPRERGIARRHARTYSVIGNYLSKLMRDADGQQASSAMGQ